MKKLVLVSGLLLSSVAFSQMTTVGSASQFGGGCDCYELTPNVAGVAGAIWSPSTLSLASDFDMVFSVYLGIEDVWGADGMTFVLQENPGGIGAAGHSLGYEPFGGNPNPISVQSIAIELDTWNSSPAVVTDIGNDHTGISSNGLLEHDLVGPTIFPGSQNIEDAAYHEFRVQWISGFNILNVYWEGNAFPLITLNNDLVTNVFGGTTDVYWGFTASTGGISNEHRVCQVSNAAFTSDLTSVCPGLPVQFTDASTTNSGIINGWAWDFGDASPIDNTQNPSHSYNGPGVYNVVLTMTDGFGCDYMANANITVLDSLTMNMTVVDATCFAGVDGQTTSNPTSGTGPYTYGWNDIGTQATQTATGLPPGTYTVMVTDNLGCVGFDSIAVSEPAPNTLTMDSLDACFGGGLNGSAIANPDNGAAPFTYLWNDGGAQTTATAIGLGAGIYTVTATDNNGCTATNSVEVIEGPPNTLTMDSLDASCNGGLNGSAIATPDNGSAPFAYLWNDGGAQTTGTATGLGAGMYTVVATDNNGCTATDSVEIIEASGMTVELDSAVITCFGGSDGEASVNVTSGTAPFTYLWDDGAAQTTDTATALPTGWYIVTVTDNNGCIVADSVFVTQAPVVNLTMSYLMVACIGDSTGEATATVTVGVSPYTYTWNDAGTQTTATATSLPIGTYTVVVTDADGCMSTDSVTVDENSVLTGSTVSIDDTGGGNGEVDLTVNGGASPYTYSWSNTETTEDITGLTQGTYDVVVTDNLGCTLTLSAVVDEIVALALASAMSPNGDNLNDAFFIMGIEGAPNNTLSITNRWGNIVFETVDYANDWKGTNKNGEDLPEGVYFVVFEVDGGEQHTTYLELRRN